LLLRISIAVP